MEAFTAIYFGACIAAVVPDVEVGFTIVPLFAIVFFLFAGQFILLSSLPTGNLNKFYLYKVRDGWPVFH